MKKILAIVLAFVLIVGATVAGTVAYLVDKTDTVTNTFTVGDVKIALTETPNAKNDKGEDIWKGTVVPGVNLPKDPKVSVEPVSEPCWLFVQLTERNWPTGAAAELITYSRADGWTPLPGHDGVYYREVNEEVTEANKANYVFDVLADNQVTVSPLLKKSQMPTAPFYLDITAYAVQKANVADAATAWGIASNPNNQ